MAAQILAPSVQCQKGVSAGALAPAGSRARSPLVLTQKGAAAARRGGAVRYRAFTVKATLGNENNAVSRLEDLLNLDVSPYTDKIIAEYIWIGGSGIDVRSKSRTIPRRVEHPSELPKWNYDGSSTGQAPGEDSEVILYPQAIFRDPFRGGNNILVICDAYTPSGEPIPTNKRNRAAQIFSDPQVVAEVPWFGIEQEYTLLQPNVKWPLGWPVGGYPGPQGPYYCLAGADKSFGRDISDAHYKACLYAGINISGTNGEVIPGQWEYQVGPSVGIEAGDHLWCSRYILEGVANCGCSIRVGRDTEKQGKGYLEDWRPASNHCLKRQRLKALWLKLQESVSQSPQDFLNYASNMDPYVVTSLSVETTILSESTLESEALVAKKLQRQV